MNVVKLKWRTINMVSIPGNFTCKSLSWIAFEEFRHSSLDFVMSRYTIILLECSNITHFLYFQILSRNLYDIGEHTHVQEIKIQFIFMEFYRLFILIVRFNLHNELILFNKGLVDPPKICRPHSLFLFQQFLPGQYF